MKQVAATVLMFAFLLWLGGPPPAESQGRGEYFNVESPQVHPIEVARIDGHDYLLVCNTPDNSVEIWDTDETLPVASRFLARVPVGLEPVSVRYVDSRSRFFVANFLGDTITSVFVDAPTGPSSLVARVIRTQTVTDEPLDMVFADVDNGQGGTVPTLFVTHMTLDAYGEYNALSLAPAASGSERLDAVVPTGTDLDFDGNPDDIAVKAPRTLDIACDRLFILGFMGGNTIRYDFDLYSDDLTGAATPTALGGLGSTNWNMEFVDDQNLFVVGAEARNANLVGEAAVAGAKTGFVKSVLYWVQNPCSGNPTILSRDVNLIPLVAQTPQTSLTSFGSKATPLPAIGAVAKKDALAQLTDLEVRVAGSNLKVFFTAFSSGRVGVIEPVAGQNPIFWKRRKINIPPVASPTGTFVGPRGLALKGPNPNDLNDAGERLYVLNRNENSVTIIDPVAETVAGGFLLNNNPTPRHVTIGREFLYSAKLSGKGFVSCSSCHMDARTDGLAWDLSDGVDTSIPAHLLPFPGFANGIFPGEKGFLVTQSLQGLLNWEVPPDIQHLFTNAPYHWRGDRATFQSFNPAFVSLLGGSMLSPQDIAAYEEFINSVHYPPNPKEDITRVLSGELGEPDDNDPNNNISGSGALKGLKIFFTVNTDGFACYGCHVLPDGSDNVLTENLAGTDPHPIQDPPLVAAAPQPIETAALRGLFQKEARLDRDGSSNPDDSPITGYEGLLHTGLRRKAVALNDFNGVATMNAFNISFFEGTACPGPPAAICPNLEALNQFLHEYDFGSSPAIGKSWTVTLQNAGSAATAQAFQTAEDQATVVNASVAVQANLSGVDRGFYLDFSGPVPLYQEEPFGTTFTRAALLAQLTGPRDRMFLMSTPLGSERRVAAPSGTATTPTGPPPADVKLQPMVPNTAYADVPKLSLFWDNGNPTFGGTQTHTVRLYQRALVDHGPAGGFGLCSIRHEAPRRFRVTARNIRHGATLHLFIQNDPNAGPPITTLRVDDPGQVTTLELVLPLYPTDILLGEGFRVWETAVEAEPQIFYRLMAGRPSGFPGVLDNVTDLDFLFQIPEVNPPAGTWTPVPWNNHWVRVVNADGTSADGGWQQLTIEPGPDCP